MLELGALSTQLTVAGIMFGSITAPLILMFITGRQRRAELTATWEREDTRSKHLDEQREADLARQDAVARHAAESSDALAISQQKIAEKAEEARIALLASNEKIAHAAENTAVQNDGQLKAIHGLVNSTLTAAKEAELAASERELTVTAYNFELRKKTGDIPDAEEVARLEALRKRVSTLRSEIAERHKDDTIATAQVKASAVVA